MRRVIREVFGWACFCSGVMVVVSLFMLGWTGTLLYGLFLIPIGVWFVRPYLHRRRTIK